VKRRLLLVALVALLAGCGGSKSTSADVGGTVPAGASQVAASVPVFVTLDSSFGGQWDALNALLGRFPGRAKLLAQIQQSLTKDGVDFDKDIKATVGPELDVAVWDIGASTKVVGLTQPKDKAGFEAALGKGTDPAKYAEVDDWVLFSDKQATLDAFKALGGSKLDGDDGFAEAMKDVPGKALARFYANGASLQDSLAKALQSAGGPAGSLGSLGSSGGSLVWAVAAVAAQSSGFKLDAVLKTKGGKAKNFDTKLLDKVPASAFAMTAFDGSSGVLGSQLDALAKNPALTSGLAQFQALTGVTLADVLQVLSGRGVIYARAGTPIPEITILEADLDVSKATGTLDRLSRALAGFTKQNPTPLTVSGVQVTQVPLGKGISLLFGMVDGNLVVTTSQAAIADLKSGGGKLVNDATFQKAEAAVGGIDSTSGLLYVNLQDAVATIASLAQLQSGQGLPASARENLAPLRGLLFAANAVDKDTLRISGFLGVQ
jgi:hypothetical protein